MKKIGSRLISSNLNRYLFHNKNYKCVDSFKKSSFKNQSSIFFKQNYRKVTTGQNSYFFSDKAQTITSQSSSSQYKQAHNHQDPIELAKKQIQKIYKSLLQQYPNDPQKIIDLLYKKCQQFMLNNKKAEIFMIFDVISDLISEKQLAQQYSSFLIISANNNFLIGKYQSVVNNCKLALPYQIKKHGEKHKSIAGIYNMLGIALSKLNSASEEAIEYLQKAFDIRKQLFGDSGQTAQVLYNIGIIQEQKDNMLESAQERYLEAIQMLQNVNLPNKLLYLRIKVRLSQLQFRIHANLQKSIKDLLRIQELSQSYRNEKLFAQREIPHADMLLSLIHKYLAQRYFSMGQYITAIKYFQICLNFLRDNNMENEDRIKVLQSISSCYINLNQFDKAIKFLEEGLDILNRLSPSEQYMFNYLKFMAFTYKNLGIFQKEQGCYINMKLIIANYGTQFTMEDVLTTQFSYLYCLGNLKKFEQAIAQGKSLINNLQKYKSLLPLEAYLDIKSNGLGYVGFAYFTLDKHQQALQYLLQANSAFQQITQNGGRLNFQLGVMRKISTIYILKKQFGQAIQYLSIAKNKILNNKNMANPIKINELVLLLVDYEIKTDETKNVQQALIQANYLKHVNEILSQIVKLISSSQRESLTSYLMLPHAIKRMLEELEKVRPYENKQKDVSQIIQSLHTLTSLYLNHYKQQIKKYEQDQLENDYMNMIFNQLLEVKKYLETKGKPFAQ